MITQRQNRFLGRLLNRLGGDDQIYMQNLARSLLFIQNSRDLAVEDRDGEAVIAVKPVVPQETAREEHDIKSELVEELGGAAGGA